MRAVVAIALLACVASASRVISSKYLTLTIPDTVYNISKYGAVADGKTDCTSAIKSAFAAATSGGTIYVPAGRYLFKGPLLYTANYQALEVASGATLLFKPDNMTSWGSSDEIITTTYSNCALIGSGTIDGQGQPWWNAWTTLAKRPRIFVTSKGSRILIKGVTLKNPPMQALRLTTTYTEVANVKIYAPSSVGTIGNVSHNTDGIDTASAGPMWLHDLDIQTGDDNVALKSNNTIVEDCYFGTGHGASIGSLCGNYLQNITFRNIRFNKTNCGARIKVKPGCYGFLKDVVYENLQMTHVNQTISLILDYDGTDVCSAETGRRRSIPRRFKRTTQHFQIGKVTYRNITADSVAAGELSCDADQPCKQLTLNSIHHPSTSKNWTCSYAYGTVVGTVTPASCLLSV